MCPTRNRVNKNENNILYEKDLHYFFIFSFRSIFNLYLCTKHCIFLYEERGRQLISKPKIKWKRNISNRTSYKKTYPVNDTFRIPYYIYSPWVKKCTLNKEGKNLFSFDCKQINPTNLKESDYVAEIQLNLYNGSKHYIILTNKGLFDVQLKELTEKEAEKLLKNKKYVALPEYIEQ